MDAFQEALTKRGMQVVVLLSNSNEEEMKKQKNYDSPFARITHEKLPTWLGTQQWNGGVGVFIADSSTSSVQATPAQKNVDCNTNVVAAMELVQQHMTFRSSGAILVMDNGSADSPKDDTNHDITYLQIPPYLQSSPSVAEAAFKALHYSQRLRLHHVLRQQVLDTILGSTNDVNKGAT